MGKIFVLVEDKEGMQKMMTRALQKAFSAQVHCIPSGQEAIEFLTNKANKFDVIILDGHLQPTHLTAKTCNGPEVAAALLQAGIKSPIVLWTDDTSMLKRFKAVFKGQMPTKLDKPCNITNILNTLTPIVEKINKEQNETDTANFTL